MSDAKSQAEPSMEEILESIRRIISEDGEAAGEDEDVLVLRELAPESASGEGVLELTDAVGEEGAPERTATTPETLAGAAPGARGIRLGDADLALEEPVKELLRPMLKEWLDDNLEPIVSRAVAQAVARAIVQLAGRADDD